MEQYIAYIVAFVAAMGVPSGVCGFLFWLLKRDIEKREQGKKEREDRIEELMLLNFRETRATNVLATATAKAVQRIPDAKCNGDMHAALEEAARIQREEKDFLVNNGIKHIFGE